MKKIICTILCISILFCLHACTNDDKKTSPNPQPSADMFGTTPPVDITDGTVTNAPTPSPDPTSPISDQITVGPSATPAPTPTVNPMPTPIANPYPTSESEQRLAEAGKAFMNALKRTEGYTNLDLNATYGFPYLICINRVQNCITVYCVDENGQYTRPYQSMVCSGGYATPLGIFDTLNKYKWRVLMGPCYGQYATRIVDGILFHSVPYYTMHKYDLEYRQYNKLGNLASHGCIRLAANDAKWIYDNCPLGTPVVIYDDTTSPGPLGKPVAIRLDVNNLYLRGWDPTDPDKANPWGDEFKAGTTLRSQLAQQHYDYAIANGLWDGTINPPERPTETPVPPETPSPEPTIDPSVTPSVEPSPSDSGSPFTPEPTPSDSASPSTPEPSPTAGFTAEPTHSPEPTTAVPTAEPTQTVSPTAEPTQGTDAQSTALLPCKASFTIIPEAPRRLNFSHVSCLHRAVLRY